MKVLAMSDIHGHLGVYCWMADLVQARQPDCLVLAGDLLGGHGDDLTIEDAQRREAREIVKLLRELKVPVLYIMGNDDQVSLDYQDALIKPIQSRLAQLGGYSFVGYQYSPPFMGGIFEKPETEIQKDTIELEPLLDEKTVLVTHCPAQGILDWTSVGGHVGSPSLKDLLRRRPIRAHIHGHIHGSFGRESIHFNVAAGRRFRGMVIDLGDLSHEIVNGRE